MQLHYVATPLLLLAGLPSPALLGRAGLLEEVAHAQRGGGTVEAEEGRPLGPSCLPPETEITKIKNHIGKAHGPKYLQRHQTLNVGYS